jgi:dUTP pyrophosphatase
MEPIALVKFKLLNPNAKLPIRGTDGSGAFDFFAEVDGSIAPGEQQFILTGIAHDLPAEMRVHLYAGDDSTHGLVPFRLQGILFDRSSMGGKHGIRLSFACLIDNDYRGEVKLKLENYGGQPFSWKRGERLCQIAYVLTYAGRAEGTKELDKTARGDGGFGSTGR